MNVVSEYNNSYTQFIWGFPLTEIRRTPPPIKLLKYIRLEKYRNLEKFFKNILEKIKSKKLPCLASYLFIYLKILFVL